MIQILCLSLLVLLTSCSSSDKTNENQTEVTETESIQNLDLKDSKSETSEENLVKSAAPVATSTVTTALSEAIQQQNFDLIQKTAAEVLTQNPKDLKALNALAMVYYKKSRFEAATYLLNKAIDIEPQSSIAYNNKGLVLLAQNEKRDAIRSFRKALEVNPKDPIAASNLGALYVQEKDFNKAVLALEIATQNQKPDFKVLNNYAISLVGTGRAKDAADIYAQILKDNPSQKEVLLNYSILLIEEMQKYREGLDLLNRLKFVGNASESREIIKQLENKAKAGLK